MEREQYINRQGHFSECEIIHKGKQILWVWRQSIQTKSITDLVMELLPNICILSLQSKPKILTKCMAVMFFYYKGICNYIVLTKRGTGRIKTV